MKLSSLIDSALVFTRQNVATKEELLNLLIHESCRFESGLPISEAQARVVVNDRENLGNTVFPSGLAAPHGRIDGFNDLLIAVGIPEKPITGGLHPIRMMTLMLTGPGGSSLYLNSLAAFMELSRTPRFETLCAASSPQTFVSALADSGIEVARELSVKSVMFTAHITAHPNDTLKEAADIFYKNNTSYLPIVDDTGAFVGELTVLDLFAIGIPDYVSKLGSLKFLRSLEPFEALLIKEHSMRIKEVMKQPAWALSPDASVIEAVLQFVNTGNRYLPVLQSGKLLGVVRYMDILHKVLRA